MKLISGIFLVSVLCCFVFVFFYSIVREPVEYISVNVL